MQTKLEIHMPTKKTSPKLNGSADALAQAFRDVILEAVEPLATKEDIDAMEEIVEEGFVDIRKQMDERLNKVAKNNQVQFAQVNKRLGKIEKTISK